MSWWLEGQPGIRMIGSVIGYLVVFGVRMCMRVVDQVMCSIDVARACERERRIGVTRQTIFVGMVRHGRQDF